MEANGTDATTAADRPAVRVGLAAALAVPAWVAVLTGLFRVVPRDWPNWTVFGLMVAGGFGSLLAAAWAWWWGLKARRAAVGRTRPTRVGVFALAVVGATGGVFGVVVALYLWWFAPWVLAFRGWSGPG